jgi:hypothetical protein
MSFTRGFQVLQLPVIKILGNCETLAGQTGIISKNSLILEKK